MICYVGLGSNSEQSRERIFQALSILQKDRRISSLRESVLYSTPALLPAEAPPDWNRIFLNGVCEFEWTGGGPRELFDLLKSVEKECGRVPAPRWSPRELDLDLLFFGDEIINEEDFVVPHPGVVERAFVLDPMAELASNYRHPVSKRSMLELRRRLKQRSPSFMEILNITPDSFSDKSRWLSDSKGLRRQIELALDASVEYLDIGAESTRPQASVVSAKEEWLRLEPVLKLISELRKGYPIFPKVSIDTYKPEVAELALDFGVDVINDVNAGKNPAMLKLVQSSDSEYVCMHSLSVPTSRNYLWPVAENPIELYLTWAQTKMDELDSLGIDLNRVILDPGIGFGKVASHSLQMLQHVEDFLKIPLRLLIGHSRKSFMDVFTSEPKTERDAESIGISLGLGLKGVEILRVHNAHLHRRAWIACQHLHPQFEES